MGAMYEKKKNVLNVPHICYTVQPCTEAHYLQLILIVDLVLICPKLLCQVEGPGHMLRRHKVIDNLDTTMKILDLKNKKKGCLAQDK